MSWFSAPSALAFRATDDDLKEELLRYARIVSIVREQCMEGNTFQEATSRLLANFAKSPLT